MIAEMITYLFSDGDPRNHTSPISRSLKKYLESQLQKNIVWLGFSEFVLFVFLIWATPIEKRLGPWVYSIGFVLLVSFLIQAVVHNVVANKNTSYWTVIGCKFSTLVAWSGLTAWALTQFEISWTSFLLLISSLGLSTIQLVIFAANMKLMMLANGIVIGPSIVINIALIQGLQGMAVGVLLVIYSVMLILIGKRLNLEFWIQAVDRARLKAIIDAIPGTLAWFNSSTELQGSNSKFEEMFGESDVRTKKLEPIFELIKKLFDSEEDSASKGFEIDKKLQYFIAQKYNFESEAILMSSDLSKEQYWQKSLENERGKVIGSARPIVCGEMMLALENGQTDTLPEIHEYIRSPMAGVSLGKLTKSFSALANTYSERHKSTFSTDLPLSLRTLEIPGELIIVLFCLLQNSIEAIEETSRRGEIKLICTKEDGNLCLLLRDNGCGVDSFLADVVFEPLFTTKPDGDIGLGLYLSQSIVESHGGSIKFEEQSEGCSISIKFPIESS